ncbi:MAG: FHA domain-containing protein [Flavobacteriales bacterium]|nr:FHA domain-containing protein [Flavobacteriales bacterium]
MNKLHLKIGTFSNNELVVDEAGIDPHHLELFCDEYGNVFITDLKSTNGTFVNDKALDGFKLLVAGDKVRLGKTYFFDWENLILSSNSVAKQVDVVASVESDETPTTTITITAMPTETPIANYKESSKINKELFIIYGVIIVNFEKLFVILHPH